MNFSDRFHAAGITEIRYIRRAYYKLSRLYDFARLWFPFFAPKKVQLWDDFAGE